MDRPELQKKLKLKRTVSTTSKIVDRHFESKDQLESLRNGIRTKTLKIENNKTKIIKDLIIF